MGRAAKLKRQRREIRRELERQMRDIDLNRQVEELVVELRGECFGFVKSLVDDGLKTLYGFGDQRLGKLWAYVKNRALWEWYMERGLPLEEAVEEAVGR